MNTPDFLVSYHLPLREGQCEHCTPRTCVFYYLYEDGHVRICPDAEAHGVIKRSREHPMFAENKKLLALKKRVTLNLPIAMP